MKLSQELIQEVNRKATRYVSFKTMGIGAISLDKILVNDLNWINELPHREHYRDIYVARVRE